MWKDFLYFNKSQRIGVIVLITLIIFLASLNWVLVNFKVEEPTTNQDFINKALAFEKTLVERDSIRKNTWKNNYNNHERNTVFSSKYATNTYSLFEFDPNTADSTALIKLGLKPYVASNIIKFRSKGGYFTTDENFAKVYGLTTQKYEELKPYIKIKERLTISRDSTQKKFITTKKTSTIIELNTADTTKLMQVYGIGRGYAKAIIRFRNQTGGFVSIEQLKEIYGMTEQNYQKIIPYCQVNTSLVKKIAINTASVERLNAHPYLNFYQSKSIYEYRRQKGKIKNIQELNNLRDMNQTTIQKIEPYLSFE